MSKIIAFCGSKSSGKSTSATTFIELVGSAGVEELAIAGHLKTACAEVFQVDYDKFINPALKEVELDDFILLDRQNLAALLKAFMVEEYDFDQVIRPHCGRICRTPRALLQYIGTEVLHPIDPLIHMKVAMKKRDPNKTTLITDLRFKAEFNYLIGNPDFLPVYVKNSGAEMAASADAHPSERQYEEFKAKCYLLNNEGSMADLKSGITEFISKSLGAL
jgi:hypothetical protein